MLKSTGVLAAAGALTLATLAIAPAANASTPSPDVISFTGEASGARPNGYAAPGHPGVLFYDTGGANLRVVDVGAASHGPAIAATTNGYSALEMRLASPTTGISLSFGYDYPGTVNATDQGELTVYRGATLVDQVDVNLNANGTMDQTIGYGGGRLINRATFRFVDAAGNTKNAYETVDDITVNPLCTVYGGTGNDRLYGTSGADVICGDQGDDTIRGGDGNDLIYPGPGNDRVYAGAGADTVMGSAGNDVVQGSAGPDDLRGGAGRDRLFGGFGNDQLTGGLGRDACNGGAGHDHASSCEVRRRIP